MDDLELRPDKELFTYRRDRMRYREPSIQIILALIAHRPIMPDVQKDIQFLEAVHVPHAGLDVAGLVGISLQSGQNIERPFVGRQIRLHLGPPRMALVGDIDAAAESFIVPVSVELRGKMHLAFLRLHEIAFENQRGGHFVVIDFFRRNGRDQDKQKDQCQYSTYY